uniref:Thyroglobulin type-1 domain-containing protein n=1 Tax=Hucho hucho TaxID=62062 RepID=A0A4W5R3H5_9TELE
MLSIIIDLLFLLPPPFPPFPLPPPPTPTGLTSCQLQRQQALLSGDAPLVPQCQSSGEYQAVQCDSARGQCWCVDLEGMEIYGTRQNGKPSQCPSSCESERSAGAQAGNVFVPSCASNGGYVPTQCQAGGQCWCVDPTGKEIFGTRQHGGSPDCGN